MHFLAMPTIAVWCDIDLEIPAITISEENKKPITNAEEENQHSWHLPLQGDLKFEMNDSSSSKFYTKMSLAYLLHEFEVQSPPPEILA